MPEITGVPLSSVPETEKTVGAKSFLLILEENSDDPPILDGEGNPILETRKVKSKNLAPATRGAINITNEVTVEVNLLRNIATITEIDLQLASPTPTVIDITFKIPNSVERMVDRIDYFTIKPHPTDTIDLRFPTGVKFSNGEGRRYPVTPTDGDQLWQMVLWNEWSKGLIAVLGINY